MKNARKILIGIIAVITVLCAFTFAGCSDKCEHQWTDATCTAPKTCSICNETEGEAKGHTYKTEYDVNESKHWYQCTVCEDKKDEADHTWNIPAATEESDKFCTVCNYVSEYQIGHVHTFDSVLSYDDEGHYYAASCGHTQEKKDYSFHQFTENTVAATCTEQGYTTYTCSCGKVVKDNYVDAHGHEFCTTLTKDGAGHWYAASCAHVTERKDYATHTYTPVVTAPTCTAQGYTTYTCSCGDFYVSDYVDATGHSVSEWTKGTPTPYDARTCKHEVTYSGTCSSCFVLQTKTEYIEMHAFTEKTVTPATCISEGTIHKFCKNEGCKYYVDAVNKVVYEEIKYTDTNAHDWVEVTGESYTHKCNNGECKATKTTVTGGTSASVSDIKNTDEVKLDKATIGLDEGIQTELGKLGTNVEIAAGTLDGTERENAINNSNLSPEDKALLGNNEIYNFTVNDGDVDDLGGTATIKIPYTLGENEDPDNIIVWYVKAGDIEGVAAVYGEENGEGYVTFTTNHFSYYTVTSISPKQLCKHLGHDLKNAHTVLPTCTDIGYSVCLRCGEQIKDSFKAALGHSWQTTVVSKSSCAQNGVTEYSCSECNLSYETVIPATGHYFVLEDQASASCTASGSMTYGCIYCDSEYSVTLPQLSHTYISKTVDPTCEERGYTEKTCTLCADTIYVNFTDATGHTPDTVWHKDPSGHYHVCITCGEKGEVKSHTPGAEATEQSAQICTECEYVIVPQLSHTHSLTKVPAVSADCVTVGNVEYYTCVCGKWFRDAEASELITDHVSVIIDAKGHTYETIEHQDSTCTEVGYTAGIKCSVCNVIIKGHVEIPAHGHVLKTEETAPTCSDAGKIAKSCLYCENAYFEEIIPALGHKYVGAITAPTCTEGGYTTFTCTRCNDSTKGEQKDALGHSYSGTWLTNETAHWHECTRCKAKGDENSHTPDRDSATTENAKSCTKCGYVIEDRIGHAHSVSTTVNEKAPTCTESGNMTYYICSCGEWFYDESCEQLITDTAGVMVKPLVHKLVYVEEKAPTCTEIGYTAGYYCERCKTYLSGHTEIPALGHNYSTEWESDENKHWHECDCGDKADANDHSWNAVSATENNDKHCTICNYVAEKQLDHAHKFDNWNNEIPASCTEPGVIGHYECTCGLYFDSDRKQVTDLTIPAPGHNHSTEWESDENKHWHECDCGDKADANDHSYENGKCSVCEKEVTEVFSYEYSEEYYGTTVSFMSDKAFTTVIWQLSPVTGERLEITKDGTWDFVNAGTIGADIHGYLQCFTVDSDGNLTLVNAPEGCAHENSTTATVSGDCQTVGYVYTGCNDCQVIVTLRLTDPTDHSYGDDGTCTVCGAKYEGGTDEPEVTVSYTYTYLTDTENIVFTFLSDKTFTGIGTVITDGETYNVNESGTWDVNGSGELVATLNDITITFTVDTEGNLTLKGVEYPEPTTRYTFGVSNEYADITIYFLSDYTLKVTGTQLNEDGSWSEVNDTGTWSFNEDGNIETLLYGDTVIFEIDENGNLTMQGGGSDVAVLYTYRIDNPYAKITVSFLSDFTLTAIGTQITDDGSWSEVNDTGTWSFNEDGTIAAILYGDLAIFEIDADGNLTMQGGGGGSDVAVLYTYRIDNPYAKITVSFLSDFTLTAVGTQITDDGSWSEVNDTGTWSFNEDGTIAAILYGDLAIFEIDADGNLTMQGGGGGTDTPETSTLYVYELKNEYANGTYTFLANGTLDLVGKQLTASGEWIEINAVALWAYDSEGKIVAIYGDQSMVFVINEDKTLTMQDDVTPDTVTLYTYEVTNPYMSITVTFLSDYTFTYIGSQLNEDGTSEDVSETGSWLFTADGRIEADLGGDVAVFLINADRSLTMSGGGGGTDTNVLYTYLISNDSSNITLSFLGNGTFTANGYDYSEGTETEINYTGTWTLNEDGTIAADLGGVYLIFMINEDGNLTLIGGGAEPEPVTELYVFTLNNDTVNITISFMSDFNFEAYGYYIDEKGNKIEYKDSFWWRYASDTAVMAVLDGEFRVFEIGEDGKTLTLIDTDDESATNVYTYEYDTESYDATLSFKSTYKLIATGWRLDPETGEYLEQFTCEGWWFIDEFGFIIADIGANYGDFILLEDGSIILKENCTHPKTETQTVYDVTCLTTGYKCTYCAICLEFVSEEYVDPMGHEFGEDGVCIRCDVKETDPEPTEMYSYKYESVENGEEIAYELTFLSNNTYVFNILKGQLEDGLDKSRFVFDWTILEDGTLSANFLGFEFFRFVIGEDGELTEYVCPHENTYTETFDPSCDEPGISFTYCHDCGEMIDSHDLEPKGHNYDESGNCINCGRNENDGNENPDTPGVDPDIKEIVYTYSGEERFNLTLYSDGSAIGSKITPSADGLSYIYMINASWSKDESGKVITVYEKTEIYTFTVDENGNLTLINTETNSCTHEDTRIESDVTNCEQGGFRKIVCNTCGLTVHSEFIDPKEHNFGEDGSCTDCGYLPCKHEKTVTETMFYATCLLSGYEYTHCVDCGDFISENYLDPTGHSFNDDGFCIHCEANVTDPEPTETYKYEYEDEEIHYVMSFLSNETFTLTMLKGQVEEGVEKDYFVGYWYMNDKGIIYTVLHGNSVYEFAIDEEGNLYEYECMHLETKTEITEATCESGGNYREFCAECGETMKETYIEPLGHDIDENGLCTRCGYEASGDHEIPVYKYQSEDLELTFCKDYTVTGTLKVIFSDGMTSTKYLKGFWSIEKETNRVTTELSGITYTFDIVNEKELVLVSSDGSEGEGSEGGEGDTTSCKHENRHDNTIAPSCTSEGYVVTVCTDCGQTLYEKPIPPIDHSYGENGVCVNCGYTENGYVSDCKHEKTEIITAAESTCILSGYQFVNCTDCGNDVSETYTEPLGHEYDESGFCIRCKMDQKEPEPTEVNSFTLVDEYVDYSFSFKSDNTFRFTGIELSADGNQATMTFVGTWTLSEDGKTVNTFFLGEEFVSFDIDEKGTLTMQGGGSSAPSCTHEYTDTHTVEPTCNNEGSIQTVCLSCGVVLHDETLSMLDHSYGEDGVCVNCGYTENSDTTDCKHENIITDKVDATCTSTGYNRTVCDDCGTVISEEIIDTYDHSYGDSGICVNCGSKQGSDVIIDSGFNGIITEENEGYNGTVIDGSEGASLNLAA